MPSLGVGVSEFGHHYLLMMLATTGGSVERVGDIGDGMMWKVIRYAFGARLKPVCGGQPSS